MERELTYATVCSGIECMSVACIGLPLRPVFFSEIEPFPCAVLKAHYPDVPNLGDMSKIQVSENGLEITNGTTTIRLHERLGILAGGTPCQSVSVAGKGEGMREGSGTRSSLAFDFVRLARELRPRWVLWENVANVLSAKHAGDFLHFLANLGDCGYSLAWRVLDAQYVRVDGMERAVPQRRRRVWVVGRLGADESVPAQILFEPDCVAGHTAPRRRAGQGFAYSLARRDRVDAGVVGDATRVECLNFQGSKSNNGVDDNLSPTLSRPQGNDCHVVDLDGDKLKPREDQRKGGNGFGINEEGAGYTLTGVDRHGVAYGFDPRNTAKYGASATALECDLTQTADQHKQPHGVAYCADGGEVAATITRQISEQSGQDNRANAVVQCYESHAQDSRVQGPIDTAPTQGSSNANSVGVSGNNPLVCFSKVSHPTAPNGEGERWDEREVAQTRNTFDNGEKRCQEVVVSTNSNGEDVAPIAENGEAQALSSVCHDAAVAYGINPRGGGMNPFDEELGETQCVCHQAGVMQVLCCDGYNQRAHEEVSMTMRSAMTGTEGNDADPKVAIGFKAGQSKDGGLGDEREVSPTLSHKPSALEPTLAQSTFVRIGSMTRRDRPTPPSEEVAHALTKTDGDAGDNAASVVQSLSQMRYIVRRLTPTEAERLMGLPSGYTIPRGLEVTDELVAEFQRIFDTFGAIMAEYEHTKPPKPKSANQVRAWLEKVTDPETCPDSPRYRATGNGWATNQPRWILTRLLAIGENIDPYTGEPMSC